MATFDPNEIRKAVEEFTPRRPQKFQDLLPAKDVIVELRQKRASYRSIADLLTQLRRLQDLQVTVEVRFITVTESFYEKIGIDFECYLADNARTPIAFWDWVETKYDADEVNSSFRASSFANRLVNGVLHRE